MFMLVSRRYERASLIVTSNKPFSAWGEIFGDDMAATAMVDRLIHHSEILSLKGDSYRLKDRDLGPRPGGESMVTVVVGQVVRVDCRLGGGSAQPSAALGGCFRAAKIAAGAVSVCCGVVRPPGGVSRRGRGAL